MVRRPYLMVLGTYVYTDRNGVERRAPSCILAGGLSCIIDGSLFSYINFVCMACVFICTLIQHFLQKAKIGLVMQGTVMYFFCSRHPLINSITSDVFLSTPLVVLPAQVWMPDEPKTTSSSARSQSLRWDDTPSSASTVLSQDDAEPASASGRHTPTDPKGSQQKGPPGWWDPPPRIHVNQRYKEQVWPLRLVLQQLCFEAVWQ